MIQYSSRGCIHIRPWILGFSLFLEDWRHYIKQVLDESNPFLPGIDSDKWAQERLYYCQNGPEALRDFTTSRIQLLNLLDSLDAADWERSASHAIFGPTSLKELVSIIVGHDQLHIQQAYRFIGDLSKQTAAQSSQL